MRSQYIHERTSLSQNMPPQLASGHLLKIGMSFDWNLSSDDEKDVGGDLEQWTRQQGFFLQSDFNPDDQDNQEENDEGMPSDSSTYIHIRTKHSTYNVQDDEDDEGEECIDWEDDTDDIFMKGIGSKLRPVSIDLNRRNSDEDKGANKRKRLRKITFRFESLSQRHRTLLRNVQRAYLLALISRAVICSLNFMDEETFALALSLIPQNLVEGPVPPTTRHVNAMLSWYTDWVRNAPHYRRQQIEANRNAGAPRVARYRSRSGHPAEEIAPRLQQEQQPVTSSLWCYAQSIADCYSRDPQLAPPVEDRGDQVNQMNEIHFVSLLILMMRSMGWRTRWVQAMETVPLNLGVDHPLVHILGGKHSRNDEDAIRTTDQSTSTVVMDWIEVCCSVSTREGQDHRKWIHVDPHHRAIDQPQRMQEEWKKQTSQTAIPYVVAVEHIFIHELVLIRRITDVTARYTASWVASLRERGWIRGKMQNFDPWWSKTLQLLNAAPGMGNCAASTNETAITILDSDDEITMNATKSFMNDSDDCTEAKELKAMAEQEVIPSSKAAFQTHPLYVIPSVLGKSEVINPSARIRGLFKGERVYHRSDVSTALPARKWLYRGRRVKDGMKPVKQIKMRARPNPQKKPFRALKTYGVGTPTNGNDDDMIMPLYDDNSVVQDGVDVGNEALFAVWQTEEWTPTPVGPQDPIPVNEFNNIELALLNPGLAHVEIRGASKVAKKLGIPYAPCLTGFEGHGGNRTPTIQGIVVHAHNEDIIRSATSEFIQFETASEMERRRKSVLVRWKKLMCGLLTKERVEREYGDTAS